MTISDLGNIGEIIGAIGVIVSLIYLAVQIRGARSVAQTRNVREIFDGARRANLAIARDPDLARVWLSGMKDFGSLSPVDRTRFQYLVVDRVLMYREAQVAYREGILPVHDHDRLRAAAATVLNTPGASQLWEELQHLFSEDLTAELNRARAGLPDFFSRMPREGTGVGSEGT